MAKIELTQSTELSLGRHRLFQSSDSEARPTKSSITTAITKSAPLFFFFLLLTPLSERQQETRSVNIFPTYAQLKTSNFTCAELNSYFSQLKWLNTAFDSNVEFNSVRGQYSQQYNNNLPKFMH